MRALAGVGLLGLLATITGLDLARIAPQPDPTVDLPPDPDFAPSPLSSDEAANLRAQADMDRLRCEPRGCEAWRYDFASGRSSDRVLGALDDGLVLVHGSVPGEYLLFDGEDGSDARRSIEILAIDPSTDEVHWTVEVEVESFPGHVPWVQTARSPHGVIVLAGGTVTAIDEDGRQQWTWRHPLFDTTRIPVDVDDAVSETDTDDPDGDGIDAGSARNDEDIVEDVEVDVVEEGVVEGSEVTGDDLSTPGFDDATWEEYIFEMIGSVAHGDVLVVEGWGSSQSGHNMTLAAVDASTGEELWTGTYRQAVSHQDALIVVHGGQVARLEPRTGEPLWDGIALRSDSWLGRAGPWLVVHEVSGSRLVDVADGRVVNALPAQLTGPLTPMGDGYLGILQRSGAPEHVRFESEAAELTLVRLDADGTTSWVEPLGEFDPWWRCCQLDVEDGRVTATGPDEQRVYDDTGELVEVTAIDPPSPDWFPGHQSLQVTPDVEVVWGDEGRRLTIRTTEGEVTVTTGRYLHLTSVDPLIVTDDRQAIGIVVPGHDTTR